MDFESTPPTPVSLYLNSGLSRASGGGSKLGDARTRKSDACIHDLAWSAVHETKVIFDWWDLVRPATPP